MNEANDVLVLSQQLTNDALTSWSDPRRKDFINTFDQRVRVARYLLIKTAGFVADKAKRRHFISEFHTQDIKWPNVSELYDNSNHWSGSVGGRSQDELLNIAQERCDLILENLPSLNQAVRIISPEMAKNIEFRDKLFDKGQELTKQIDKLSKSVSMDDFPQDMTLADFQTEIRQRDKERRKLIQKLDEIGDEGRVLERKINKYLYEGLPGLSDAVIAVITEYLERATAFGTMNRRVAEQVQFGDSAAAMEIFSSFEKDEIAVSSNIKTQFDQALETLKLAGQKKGKTNVKTLLGGKKK